MRATSFNHVSIHAYDLDGSGRFYTVLPEIQKLSDTVEQTEEGLRATLYLKLREQALRRAALA